MKKTISVLILLFINLNLVLAQPGGMGQDDTPRAGQESENNTGKQETDLDHVPVGTATALLLGLGAGVLGYKIRRNGKQAKC